MYEQLDIFDMTRPTFQIDKPIRLIELFAGVGSQAMALRDLGADFEHYRVVEFDRFAIASYNAIHGTDFEITDICNISGADLGICDTDKFCYIMTYSFPCQDLSVAGKQKGMTKGSGTRSGLLWEVERLLNECDELPQVLLMENVPQVHSKANMSDFQKWIDFLESKGFSNYWQDLNAKDYGVAQNRDRCFMVSLLGEWNYKFPRPIPLKRKLFDYTSFPIKNDIAGIWIKTEEGQNVVNKMWARINGDICCTITARGYVSYNCQYVEQNEECRRISPLEQWLLMGFSQRDYNFAEKIIRNKMTSKKKNNELSKQAGNSIVKNVLMAIFGQMMPGKENIYKEL